MEYKTVFLSELKPASYNPRKKLKPTDPEYQRIKRSIEEFGYVDPIIVNSDYTIIGGHQRLNVLLELGQTSAGVIVVDIDKTKEKALNVALNKITGEWDLDQLSVVIADLKNDNFDITLTGFDEKELTNLFPMEAKEDDYEPPPEIKTDIKRGDIFLLGKHRVMCGDSTSKEDVERLMDGKKAELLFTSPPYSDMRTYDEGTDISVATLTQFIHPFSMYSKYLVINLGLQFKGGEVIPYWQEYIDTARGEGLKLLAWNVWDKSQAGSIAQATNMFLLTHEWLFVFGENRKDLNRTVPNNLEEYAKRHGNDFLKGLEGKRVRDKDGGMFKTTSATYTHHQLHSVLPQTPELSTQRKLHPAMFPVALVAEYILAMTNCNDIITDPFLGSGTTLIACEQLNRIAYGMEISPQYCEVICQRWEKLTGKQREKVTT